MISHDSPATHSGGEAYAEHVWPLHSLLAAPEPPRPCRSGPSKLVRSPKSPGEKYEQKTWNCRVKKHVNHFSDELYWGPQGGYSPFGRLSNPSDPSLKIEKRFVCRTFFLQPSHHFFGVVYNPSLCFLAISRLIFASLAFLSSSSLGFLGLAPIACSWLPSA